MRHRTEILRLFFPLTGFLCTFFLGSYLTADIIVFNSTTPAENTAEYNSWLSAIGISAPEHFEDFETGFTNNQNVSGVSGLFAGGMIIEDTGPGTPEAIIRSGSGIIGGSDPVGIFSLTHDEQTSLVLDFSANPVDYIGFKDIDQSGTAVTVMFEGGGSVSFTFETTATAGNTAEFFGIYRNDMPRITAVFLDATGDGRWGIDNIAYGQVGIPEPSSLAVLTIGLVLVSGTRRIRRRA